MNAQPLVTKTRVPRLPLDWVARPRLSIRLNEALRQKLLLVSAPAGYGKTTLVVEALSDFKKPVGWLSLDAGDNVPGSFLTYLATALQAVFPGICQPILNALQSPQPPPAEWALTAIVNSVAGCEDNFALVLDDYHIIESPAVHEAVAFLVEHLPEQAHLIITSRSDPPLPLSRWRVKGDLAEIRAADLAFTAEEASAFFQSAAGISLSGQDLATLESRTEGWIAGLKMAALSLQGKKDVSSYIRAFSGSHRYVLDYLADEVLNRQPPEVKQFLLDTSVLERLSGPLCDAVTERSDGQAMLAQLEQENLFISPLDDEREWYRYHQLFSTILRNQLARSGTERASALHKRASDWYDGAGLTEEAIEHALLAGDAGRAAGLLENAAPHILRQGRALAVLSYLPRIPQSLILERPWLCVSLAWAALLGSQWDVLPTMLSGAGAALAGDSDHSPPTSPANLRPIKGHTLSIQGYIAQAQGDIARSIKLAEEADREIPADDLVTRSANLINLAINYLIVGDIAKAASYLEAASEAGRESGNYAIVLSAQAYLADTEMQRARLDRATAICQETIEQGASWGGAYPLPYTALAYILLGQIMYEQDDLEAAARNLTEGIKLAEANRNWTFMLKGYLTMARLSQAQGDSRATALYFRQAEEAAPRALQARESRQISARKAQLELHQGDMSAASDWARKQEATLPISQLPGYPQEYDYLALMRVKIARGECRGLAAYLDEFTRNAESQGRTAAVIEALVLKALALDAPGESGAAREALDRALSLGKPAGYARTFVDEGAPMAGLLRKAIAGGVHAGYASRLLGAILESGGPAGQPAGHVASAGPVEALSEREMTVLNLIAAGRSNQQIASDLFIALGTVKKHTSNIFGKLGVESRTQALVRARELGII